jgi:dTDP-3-amino-3,4,6-trideoxy-alpha-D-glucose transaminase
VSAAAIPFLNLRVAHAGIAAELDAAWQRVASSGRLVLGPEVEAFEHAFAAYCGAAHCVGVGNGLDALTLILRALGIGAGDEVVVPSHTFIATWLAVTHAGATPVPVEIDPGTYTLDAARVASAITPRTRALLPVHLYGQTADMTALAPIAARHGLALIEDAAQAHGAAWRGVRAGALGTAAGFSFYPAKNLGALGDAGAVVTNDAALAERVRRLRNYGARARYDHDVAGVNSRLDELQAALLAVKLRHLEAWNAQRRAAAARYADLLRDAEVALPAVAPGCDPVWHLFVIRVAQRDRVAQTLRAAGIETLVHYPVPPHLQAAYAELQLRTGSLPIAERLAAQVLSLPLWPQIGVAAQARVRDTLLRALRS